MKKYLLGAAAALAVGVPAAQAETTGHLDFSYQTASIDWSSGSDDDVDTWALGGALITPLHGNWNLQFDANHMNYTWNDSDYDAAANNTSAHIVHRTDGHAVGGYVGFGSIWGQTLYMYGLEGQIYMPNATIGGVVQRASSSDYYDYSAWDARVTGSYFMSDQLAFNGSLSYTDFDDYDTSVTGIGIGAEYRFTNCPWSVNGNYLNESWDYGSSDADVDLFRIGLSYDFGTGSARERSQEGASFDSARPFVDVWTRWD